MGTSTAFQIAIAAMFSELIEKMKASNNPAFAWVTSHTELLNKILAGVVAFLTALGIATTWMVDPVTNLGTLTFTGIPTDFKTISSMLVLAFEQYWLMKGYFKVAIKGKESDAEIRNVVKN